ncbi:hypothetical protein [Symbioplanes lichenis]|uniref:hypothetical protein n=1 Tax=Symbioplanes lichenis TaxID=1629072 RepID=UPI0027397392|nr:hypothetical protein [Actinoplanes lichenis]
MNENLKSAGWIAGGVAGLALCACCGSSLLSGIEDMYETTPHAGLATLAAVVAAGLLALGWRAFSSWRARRELAAWVEWEELPAAGPWPWASALLGHAATPLQARMGTVDGLRVVAGEIAWSGDALPRLTDQEGTGVFAAVRLPRTLPRVAVLRRNQASGKKFEERFDVVGEGRLVDDVLRHVHFEETVPPWSMGGDELVLVVRIKEPVRPRHIRDAAQRAAWVAQLLLLNDSRLRTAEASESPATSAHAGAAGSPAPSPGAGGSPSDRPGDAGAPEWHSLFAGPGTPAAAPLPSDPTAAPSGDPTAVPPGNPTAVPPGDPTAVPPGNPTAIPPGDPTADKDADAATLPLRRQAPPTGDSL